MIFSLEDLADRVGTKPSRDAVEELVPRDESYLDQLIGSDPGQKYQLLWGYLSSIAAERSPGPLLSSRPEIMPGWSYLRHHNLPGRGKRSCGREDEGRQDSRPVVRRATFWARRCPAEGSLRRAAGDYAFRNMRGGFGVVRGIPANPWVWATLVEE